MRACLPYLPRHLYYGLPTLSTDDQLSVRCRQLRELGRDYVLARTSSLPTAGSSDAPYRSPQTPPSPTSKTWLSARRSPSLTARCRLRHGYIIGSVPSVCLHGMHAQQGAGRVPPRARGQPTQPFHVTQAAEWQPKINSIIDWQVPSDTVSLRSARLKLHSSFGALCGSVAHQPPTPHPAAKPHQSPRRRFGQLQQADVSGLAPAIHASERGTVLRPDEARVHEARSVGCCCLSRTCSALPGPCIPS